jgi:hypothetical protein
MGTSRPSDGSPSGVPMVPSWVPDIPPGLPDDTGNGMPPGGNPPPTPKPPLTPIAPAGRFRSTRTTLGRFGASGGRDVMRKGVGEYVKTGLGGSGIATLRFGGTARTVNRLYSILGGAGATPGEGPRLDRDVWATRSARDVIDAIIETACPVDGTQDKEASRQSINDALSDLLKHDDNADLLNLTERQLEFVTERFVAMDIYRRFMLDVGKSIQDKAPSATAALSRLKEVKEYIRETVSASFRKVLQGSQKLTGSRITQVVKRALTNAFDVFSGYAE